MRAGFPLWHRRRGHRGQALVELALVLPLFLMVLFGIIILGIGVFYQQQVTNAAREAARYAAIHSATALKPVVGHLDPYSEDPPGVSGTYAASWPLTYTPYFTPANRWEVGGEGMTPAARARLWGLNPNDVDVAACWSGYRDDTSQAFDAPPDELTVTIGGSPVTYQTHWAQCTIDGQDPTTSPSAIGCAADLATHDEASSMSEGFQNAITGNTVTAYACYVWSPPMAGFLLIPQQVTLRAIITEAIERQQ